jgi:hypothetical protein
MKSLGSEIFSFEEIKKQKPKSWGCFCVSFGKRVASVVVVDAC